MEAFIIVCTLLGTAFAGMFVTLIATAAYVNRVSENHRVH